LLGIEHGMFLLFSSAHASFHFFFSSHATGTDTDTILKVCRVTHP
jgi:hypothetical protein